MKGLTNIRIDSAKATILCVDDDADTISQLAHTLLHAGFACECCHDADAARRSLHRYLPDLIIAGVEIGSESGCQLFRKLQDRIEHLGEVPMIFLSDAGIPDAVRQAHAAGAAYYLSKPFDPNVLLELVDKALWMPHIVRNRVRGRRPTGAAYIDR
ncbi:MAG: response regulator [Planctomycetales bacterium]|nr:response regulator [Planctomycetales bacterium]NIM08443.1 response regulator [Planctomycetales bacterium]NIN07919.1 response regulator [Planctomycetales bacterium]NIN77049.1 response regulator [Planctomycetales bacterium]NIO34234.1 response regulator [Planctomycetales bacterium]